MPTPIHVVVLFSVKQREIPGEDTFMQLLRSYIQNTRKTPGCLNCTVLKGMEEPSDFCLQAEWESLEAHEAHLDSPYFKAFAAPFIGRYMYTLAPRVMTELVDL